MGPDDKLASFCRKHPESVTAHSGTAKFQRNWSGQALAKAPTAMQVSRACRYPPFSQSYRLGKYLLRILVKFLSRGEKLK